MGKKKLFSVTIEDCNVETFTVGGAGGGGKDTSNTGVRLQHRESGATARCVDHRSQRKNKEVAFGRMARTPLFRAWAKHKAMEQQASESIDTVVEKLLEPDKLKVEYRTASGWEVVPAEKIIE